MNIISAYPSVRKYKIVVVYLWPSGKILLQNMNRTLLLALSGLLLASLLVCGILSFQTNDYAKIIRLQGDVSIYRSGEKISARSYMVLNSRDRIETSPGSFVEVAYDDKMANVIRIDPSSRVVLESSVITKNTEIFMDRGRVMAKLNKMAKGSSFKIRTPVAISGVRGTGFAVAVDGNSAVITEYESAVYVKGITRSYEEMPGELVLEEGWKASVTKFEVPLKAERLTDAEYKEWKDWAVEIWSMAQESASADNRSYKILPAANGVIGYDAHNAVSGCLQSVRSHEAFSVAR